MEVAMRIERKLREQLQPTHLDIRDDSGRHAGHAGARPEGETHFDVTVVSDRFDGLSKVERHRLVYKILAEELADRVHALALSTTTPSEAGSV